jgi:hypothetical protein
MLPTGRVPSIFLDFGGHFKIDYKLQRE